MMIKDRCNNKEIIVLFILMQCFYGYSNDLVVSRIQNQTMYSGSRKVIYFSTLSYLDTANINSNSLPKFGTLLNDGHGSGRIIFDAELEDVGEYVIDVNVISEGRRSTQYLHLTVNPIPETDNIYYIDPVNGSDENIGSFELPWKTLGTVLNDVNNKIKPGSFVFLRSGYHGSLNFWGRNEKAVNVLSQSHHTPSAKSLNFSFTDNWIVENLIISPQTNNELNNLPLVVVNAGCTNINISNCYLYSFEDQNRWSKNQEWYNYSGNGIISSGTQCTFVCNLLRNTWFSTELKGSNQDFSYNIIDGFGADAMRGLANDLKFEYNQVKNSMVYDYDDPITPQHDDLFQSWTFNLPIKNIILRGNQMTDISNPNLRLPSEITQGIVDFDGFAEGWTIENNLIIIHHAHGIALYGANNCKIVNNTVVKNPFQKFNPTHLPWIRINPTKISAGNLPSICNLVQNNLAHSYQTDNLEPATLRNNLFGYIQTNTFNDYLNWNFNIRSSSTAYQSGRWENAPKIDLYNAKRQNNGINIGCHENNDSIFTSPILDYEPHVEILEIGINHVKLKFNATKNTINHANYKLKFNDQNIISCDTIAYIFNLSENTFYNINVTDVDVFHQESGINNHIQFKTLSYTDDTTMLFLSADETDFELNSKKNKLWCGSERIRVGFYENNYTQCGVVPFTFPSIPSHYKIIDADLIFYLEDKVNINTSNIDIYGIDDIFSSNFSQYYFEGLASQSQNNHLIETSYITHQDTANKYIQLSQDSRINLLNYLTFQLNAGIALGDKLIFRLNANEKIINKGKYYTLASGNSDVTSKKPLLKLILKDKTSKVMPTFNDNLFSIIPNPLDASRCITLNMNDNIQNAELDVFIHSNDGKLVAKMKIKSNTENQKVDLHHLNLISGLYHITIIGDHHFGAQTFIIH